MTRWYVLASPDWEPIAVRTLQAAVVAAEDNPMTWTAWPLEALL